MKKAFSTLLLFAYFVAVLLATQELSSSHHDSQVTQQSAMFQSDAQANYSADLDLDHKEDTHSSSGNHGDCCVVGCSHHPGMITVVSSAFLLDNSALFLFSQFIYQAPDLATLKRPPIA